MISKELLKRKPGEDRYQYTWRIGKYMEAHSDWEDATPIINKELGKDFGESAHRKLYQLAKRVHDSVFQDLYNDDEYVKDVRKLELELDRAKQKYRDERNELNRINRKMARFEENANLIKEALAGSNAAQYNINISDSFIRQHKDSGTSLIIELSDLHIGEFFDSPFGTYNSDIAKDRLTQFAKTVAYYQQFYNAQEACVIMCGDLISGNVHPTISMTNRENVVEQVKTCSELIAYFLAQISPFFDTIRVNDVPGNHSRITANKDNCLPGEKLDVLIPIIAQGLLSQRYEKVNNVVFQDERITKYGDTISCVELHNKKFVIVHGDYDNIQSSSTLFNLENMLKFKPYAIICGHKHHFFSSYAKTKVFQGGCLSGSGDTYTETKRLSGDPSQLILACDESGVIGIHPVELV